MFSCVKWSPHSPADSDGLGELNKALTGAKGDDKERTAKHPNKALMPWAEAGRVGSHSGRRPRNTSKRSSLYISLLNTCIGTVSDCIIGLAIPVTKNIGILPYPWLQSCYSEPLPFLYLPRDNQKVKNWTSAPRQGGPCHINGYIFGCFP